MDSSAGGKNEDAHGTSVESQYIKKIDPFETYGKIVEKKRMELARTAQYEKQAQQLTRKFIDEKVALEAKKLEDQKSVHDRLFAKNLKSSKQSEAAQVLLERMKREERSQVMVMMKEMKDRRFQEDEEHRHGMGERDYLAQGRKLHMEIERGKWKEMLEQQRRELKERHDGKIQAWTDRNEAKREEDAKQQKASQKQQEVKGTRMADTRRKEDVQRKEKFLEVQSARDAKIETLISNRRALLQGASQSAREKSEQRERRRQEFETKRQGQTDRVQQENLRKMEAVEARLAAERQENHERVQEKARERTEHRDERLRAAQEVQREQQEALATRLEDKYSRSMSWVQSSHSQESQNEAAKASKEYLRLRHEFDAQSTKMLCRKKYDALAKPAEALAPEGEDSRAARMRSLYNMYIAEKPTPKDSVNYDKLPTARKQKVYGVRHVRCGLCEQDYVPDNLPGITTRATIAKLRKGWMSKTDDPQLRGGLETEVKGPPSSSALYDKVRLCALCFQFVRQHNRTAAV